MKLKKFGKISQLHLNYIQPKGTRNTQEMMDCSGGKQLRELISTFHHYNIWLKQVYFFTASYVKEIKSKGLVIGLGNGDIGYIKNRLTYSKRML